VILSLGSNCYPKLYIDKYVKSGPTSLFDYIGTSIWSIRSLIESGVTSLKDVSQYDLLPLFDINTHTTVTHLPFYLRFKHDANTIDDIAHPEFFSKLQRRFERFESVLKNAKCILFLRYKESQTNRIQYYPDKGGEAVEIHTVLPFMRSTYGDKPMFLIYINDEKDGWEGDILYVQIPSLDIHWVTSPHTIHALFLEKQVYESVNARAAKLDSTDIP
jgi:hypothetical protein